MSFYTAKTQSLRVGVTWIRLRQRVEPCSGIEPGLLAQQGSLLRRHRRVQCKNGANDRHRTHNESPQQNDVPSPCFVNAPIFVIQFKIQLKTLHGHVRATFECW